MAPCQTRGSGRRPTSGSPSTPRSPSGTRPRPALTAVKDARAHPAATWSSATTRSGLMFSGDHIPLPDHAVDRAAAVAGRETRSTSSLDSLRLVRGLPDADLPLPAHGAGGRPRCRRVDERWLTTTTGSPSAGTRSRPGTPARTPSRGCCAGRGASAARRDGPVQPDARRARDRCAPGRPRRPQRPDPDRAHRPETGATLPPTPSDPRAGRRHAGRRPRRPCRGGRPRPNTASEITRSPGTPEVTGTRSIVPRAQAPPLTCTRT
ncbi:hypothetical protein HBB16_11255 [Pseudonocardia sp. MCCB 268]|nr:hypothetical protein [Pseudonocardia cytotoxica]